MNRTPEALKIPLIKRARKAFTRATGRPAKVYGVRYDIWCDEIPDLLKNLIITERFEADETSLVRKHLDRYRPIVDLGGGLGVVSLVVADVIESVPHIILEPNPRLIQVIDHQFDLNGFECEIRNEAYHPSEDIVYFEQSDALSRSVTSEEASPITIGVKATALYQLTSDFDTRFSLVCDIEGAETGLFKQELDFLERRCDQIIVELHPHLGKSRRCLSILDDSVFDIIDKSSDTYVLTNTDRDDRTLSA